jgi:branched-chain amino acid transport system substrate-binding protein
MRLRLPFTLALATALSLAGSSLAGAAPEPVIVGVVISTSGPSAPLGVPQKNALALVETDVNAHGGVDGRPLHFEIVDDEAKPDVAAQLVQQLIGKGAVAIICGTRTATSAAATRVTTGANVVQLFLTPSTELWKTPKGVAKTLFQVASSSDDEARAYVGYTAKTLKAKTIAIVHDENQYGTVAAAATADAAKADGLTVVADESYPGDATDFTPQLLRVKAAKPDAVMLLGATNTPALLTVQARTLGIAVPFVGSSAILSPAFLKVVGPGEDHLYAVSNLDFSNPDAVSKKAMDAYAAAYNAPLVGFGGFAYDAGYMIAKALVKAHGKYDGTSVASALETMGVFKGTTGAFHYTATDHNGLSYKDVHIAVARQGVWTTIDE